ncbi:MAG: choice-of-anchor J domain-containing protein [Bacteroidaceae bacterium]|nr:choice-of-anchor J domain-containing protein [Bacteroidaceae bacterium]
MKKIFTTIHTLFICTTSLMSQVIYSTDFKTEDDFKAWTVIDVNNDTKTWMFDEVGEPSHLYYTYDSANPADDWIISPALSSDKSGALAISFKVKGSSYTEKLELMYGDAPNAESMTNRVSDVLELKDNISTHSYLIDIEAGKPIHLGFRACSDADKWRLYLCEVKIQFTDTPIDLYVSEITSPKSDFGLSQEEVTVKVKNNGSIDVNSFEVAFSVNENIIATEKVDQFLAKGAELEYTFKTKADLSTPRTLFNIKAWTIEPNDINNFNDTCYTEVLHKAPASIPYYMGFEHNEYTDGITTFNLNDDDGNWDIYTDPWWNLAHTGDYCLAYNYNRDNNANDWAILEPISIEEAGYYVLRFWFSGDNTHPEKLGVYYGNEGTPSAMTNKIVEYAPFAHSEYVESINIIYLEKQSNLYIGFYAFSDKDENWICIDDVSLEKISSEDIDLAVTNISNPTNYVHKGTDKNIEFTIRSLCISDVDATIIAKLDDNIIKETNETIKAQAIVNYTIEGALDALPAGEHTLTIEVQSSDDKVTENNTFTLSFRVMGTPTEYWDFEDGVLPSEFTFRSEDDGTVNSSAGEEFNEEGWGIFNIQTHPLYGEHMLAGTSWLDGTERADRWCVLPEFKADSESYLVWDVASFNPSYLESYSIMVSTSGDDSWYYFTQEEFINESADFKTRGVSLAEYANEESIHIAFRIRSKNCENLILDNIALYGGMSTGIENISDKAFNIVVENNNIEVTGDDVISVALYNANGILAEESYGKNISTNNLKNGIYVIKVTTNSRTYNQKIIIK